MKRRVWYVIMVLAAAILAITSYRLATRPIVVGRAVLGEPPPMVRQAANLVGRHMPAFVVRDVNGSTISSDALRGRVVVLSVWATWCRPCKEELPRIENEIWRKHRGQVAVIAIALGETAATVTRFNQQSHYSFTMVPDPDRRVTSLFDRDAPIPRTYVVDRRGRIVHQSTGYGTRTFAELIEVVERQLAP